MDELPRGVLTPEQQEAIRKRDSLPVLPDVYLTMAHLIGQRRTVRFAREFGGDKHSLSANPRPDNDMVRVIGLRAVKLLYSHFGGDVIKWPTARNFLDMLDAREQRRQGKSYRQIRRRLRISLSSVQRYCAGVEPEVAVVYERQAAKPKPSLWELPLFAWRRRARAEASQPFIAEPHDAA